MPAIIRENQIEELKQRLDAYIRAKEGVPPSTIDDPEELALITQHRVAKCRTQLENMGVQIEQTLGGGT